MVIHGVVHDVVQGLVQGVVHGVGDGVVHGNTWCGASPLLLCGSLCITASGFLQLQKENWFYFLSKPNGTSVMNLSFLVKILLSMLTHFGAFGPEYKLQQPFLSIWELIWVTQSGESQNYPESDTWKNFKMQFRKGGKICTTVVICQRQPAFTSKSYFIPVVKCHGSCFSTCFSLQLS